ncbi:MAG: hypothetical protein IJU95_03950 [Treponema sp.]|nr:hypothetical protein [Treponema sp.]
MRKSMSKYAFKAVLSAIFLLYISTGIRPPKAFSQTKPLYRLPLGIPSNVKSSPETEPLIIGCDDGLYRLLSAGTRQPIWTAGSVSQIIRTANFWYILSDRGVVKSADLSGFRECNEGLPFLTVKSYDGEQKQLDRQVQILKDLAVDPFDENILVTATKDSVYLSRDGAESWTSIGSTSRYTPGIKAVACAHMKTYNKAGEETGSELVVFMSHSIYGFSYYRADAAKPAWIDVSAGFTIMPSLTQTDELSDILPVVVKDSDGKIYADIYLANSYFPNIYRFDWESRRAVTVYKGKEAADTIDSLCQSGGQLVFATVGDVASLSLDSGSLAQMPDASRNWISQLKSSVKPNAAYIPQQASGFSTALQLSELWLLRPDKPETPYGDVANGRKALYASAYQLRNAAGIEKYKKLAKNNGLNALVVDMKDDYGLLRFQPESELLKAKGSVTMYKIDVENFVSEMKNEGIYLIARIVVFKDKNLASYGGGKYAAWDWRNKKPWVGVRGEEDVLDEDGNVMLDSEGQPLPKKVVYYDENWVDPYSEEVWQYNIEIARELVARGFDEIQFDYIRFPTDGKNMGNISFRWKDEGMDKESALLSFLRYARQNIQAPIGIDIYGANGWYRSGTRTGQDVELFCNYVDVVCPMFYPSHFEQSFMEYKPVKERPYRIYFFGSYRNTVSARNRMIVRPWVQAFYMGVRYDRLNYDKDYVRREIFGVRDALNRGYMYWNNSGGDYGDISPDISDDELSPWYSDEAALQTRLPAFSSGARPSSSKDGSSVPLAAASNQDISQHRQDMISILNSMLYKEYESDSSPRRFLRVLPLWKQ